MDCNITELASFLYLKEVDDWKSFKEEKHIGFDFDVLYSWWTLRFPRSFDLPHNCPIDTFPILPSFYIYHRFLLDFYKHNRRSTCAVPNWLKILEEEEEKRQDVKEPVVGVGTITGGLWRHRLSEWN